MKIRLIHWQVLGGGILVGVIVFLCRISDLSPKHLDRDIPPADGIRPGGNSNDVLIAKNGTKRKRPPIARQRKNADFYIWRAQDLKPGEAKVTISHAYEDLDENKFMLFIIHFWSKNMHSMSSGEIVEICESLESIEGKSAIYRPLFGGRSSMTAPDELEKSKQIAQLVPSESLCRQAAFTSYFQALTSNCVSLDDFTIIVHGLSDLKTEEDQTGARNAIASALGMRIQKDPGFLDVVRGWNTEDEVKRRVLIFHPIDGILR